MSSPTPPEADIALIVRELGGHRSQPDVCRILCAERGYDWLAAQRLVDQVVAERRASIARRQAPLLLAIGLITLAAGLALVGVAAFALLNSPLRVGYLVRGGLAIFTGLGMIGGSAIGLARAIRAMWG